MFCLHAVCVVCVSAGSLEFGLGLWVVVSDCVGVVFESSYSVRTSALDDWTILPAPLPSPFEDAGSPGAKAGPWDLPVGFLSAEMTGVSHHAQTWALLLRSKQPPSPFWHCLKKLSFSPGSSSNFPSGPHGSASAYNLPSTLTTVSFLQGGSNKELSL